MAGLLATSAKRCPIGRYRVPVAILRRKRHAGENLELPLESRLGSGDKLAFTAIPEDCLSGGVNEAAYKDAYERFLTAQSDEELAAAGDALRELGVADQMLSLDG